MQPFIMQHWTSPRCPSTGPNCAISIQLNPNKTRKKLTINHLDEFQNNYAELEKKKKKRAKQNKSMYQMIPLI